MKVAHFYHCYAAGAWERPVAEHLDALEDGEFDGYFAVGLIGNRSQRRDALAAISSRRKPDDVVEANRGWEQLTLDAVHSYAERRGGAVLYAHTKGASHKVRPTVAKVTATIGDPVAGARLRLMGWTSSPDDYLQHFGGMSQDRVREVMTDSLVRGWRDSAAKLENGKFDAAGLYLYSNRSGFVANFWVATCKYLRKLPRCPRRYPVEAVTWISLCEPRLLELPPPGDPCIESPCGARTTPHAVGPLARVNSLVVSRLVPVCTLVGGNRTAETLERRFGGDGEPR